MKKFIVSSAIAIISCASAGNAGWKRVTSEHFTLYSEADEAVVRNTVVKLEKFDTIVRAFSATTKPGSPVKLTIFQMRNMDAVKATLPYESYGVGGYYTTSARGPFLVATREGFDESDRSARKALVSNASEWGNDVMQHEYLHHFMYQYFPATYPTWYSEGFAEYYGTMKFKEGNVIEVGHAPLYRMEVIKSGWFPMRKLLAAKSYADVGDNLASLYAQGWLLTHYAASNPKRGRDLKNYLYALNSGADYAEAAKSAFGENIELLDKEMQAHAKNLTALRFPLKAIADASIKVEDLSAAEASALRYDVQMFSGMPRAELVKRANIINDLARSEPGSLYIKRLQAELNILAGQWDSAESAANDIEKSQPQSAIPYFIKGEAAIGRLSANKSKDDAAWNGARDYILKSIKLDAALPQALVALYDSYTKQGVVAPPEAQNALMKALTLMPQDDGLRYKVASDFEARDMLEEALFIIKPAALSSFSGDEKEAKKRRKDSEKAAEKYTGMEVNEPPLEMYKRLEAKINNKKQATSPAT
jgi:hypothetical protein